VLVSVGAWFTLAGLFASNRTDYDLDEVMAQVGAAVVFSVTNWGASSCPWR
jgi:hypothetical protein